MAVDLNFGNQPRNKQTINLIGVRSFLYGYGGFSIEST